MPRALFAPSIVQPAAVDCGPAALWSTLRGHGVSVGFEDLRVACRTQLDGTSIEALEDLLGRWGFEPEQICVPPDHVPLLGGGLLPAILVLRLPSGLSHFVVMWRRHGPVWQVMDPAIGRRWCRWEDLARLAYVHEATCAAEDWAEFAGSDAFSGPLRRRLAALGLDAGWLERAGAEGVPGLAALDAVVRMLAERRGRDPAAPREELERLLPLATAEGPSRAVPGRWWSAVPEGEEVTLRGAVLLRVGERQRETTPPGFDAVHAGPVAGWREGSGGGLAAGLGAVEGLARVGAGVAVVGARPAALAGCAAVIVGAQALGTVVARREEDTLLRRVGSVVDSLDPRFLLTRPPLDVVARGRGAADVVPHRVEGARGAAALAEGVAWGVVLARVAPLVLLAVPVVGVLVAAARAWSREREVEAAARAGALARNQLDAVRGAGTLREVGGAGALGAVFAAHLAEWGPAEAARLRARAVAEGLPWVAAAALVAGVPSGSLLAMLAAFRLPFALEALARASAARVGTRMSLERLVSLLGAPRAPGPPPGSGALAVRLRGASVSASGTPVLDGVDLALAAGEHVAVVGPSGAGKSTLAEVLRGLRELGAGTVEVDGAAVEDVGCLQAIVVGLDPGDDVGLGLAGLPGPERARARLATPVRRTARMVVLDEAFHGADRDARAALLAEARRRWAGVTLLHVGHDIAEVTAFPRVIVLAGGRIVGDGAPADLLAEGGELARLLAAEGGGSSMIACRRGGGRHLARRRRPSAPATPFPPPPSRRDAPVSALVPFAAEGLVGALLVAAASGPPHTAGWVLGAGLVRLATGLGHVAARVRAGADLRTRVAGRLQALGGPRAILLGARTGDLAEHAAVRTEGVPRLGELIAPVLAGAAPVVGAGAAAVVVSAGFIARGESVAFEASLTREDGWLRRLAGLRAGSSAVAAGAGAAPRGRPSPSAWLAAPLAAFASTPAVLAAAEGLAQLATTATAAARERAIERAIARTPPLPDADPAPYLFTESLAFNLLLGRAWPASAADLRAAEALCRALGLGSTLDRMPSGIFETVGEGGWLLSHGERARVFLARALLARRAPRLGRALDALDPPTRLRVARVLRARRKFRRTGDPGDRLVRTVPGGSPPVTTELS